MCKVTKGLQKIAPNISSERVATFIFYALLGLLGLVGSAAAVVGVFGGGAATVSLFASLPYANMAGFIATTLLKNPALTSLILHIIHDSVCLFVGEAVAVFVVGGVKIKSLINDKALMNKEKEAEKERTEGERKADAKEITGLRQDKAKQASEITQLKQEKEHWEDRFNNLEKRVSALIAATAAPHNAQPPVDPAQATPGSANPDVIY